MREGRGGGEEGGRKKGGKEGGVEMGAKLFKEFLPNRHKKEKSLFKIVRCKRRNCKRIPFSNLKSSEEDVFKADFLRVFFDNPKNRLLYVFSYKLGFLGGVFGGLKILTED